MQPVESHAHDRETQSQEPTGILTWSKSLSSAGGFLAKLLCCLFLPILLIVMPCISFLVFMLAPHWYPTDASRTQINDTMGRKLRNPIMAYPCKLLITSCIMLNMQWIQLTLANRWKVHKSFSLTYNLNEQKNKTMKHAPKAPNLNSWEDDTCMKHHT